MNIRRKLKQSLFLIILLLASISTFSQDTKNSGEKIDNVPKQDNSSEAENDLFADETFFGGEKSDAYFNWGGFINNTTTYSNYVYHNSIILDFRIFASLALETDKVFTEFFFQLKKQIIYGWRLPEENKLNDIFFIDSFYTKLETKNVLVSFGKDDFLLGNGLCFNNHIYGFYSSVDFPFIQIEGLIGYTGWLEKSADSYKFSITDTSEKHSNRMFYGGLIAFKFLDQKIFPIYVGQYDFYSQSGTTTQDKSDSYISNYIGLGYEGELIPYLFINGEFVYEFGTIGDQTKISSFGAIANLMYVFDAANTAFSLKADYKFGSGDSDRIDATYSDSNLEGEDNMFKTFSNINTGYVYRPELSNIHIIKLEGKINPLFFVKVFNKLQLTLSGSLYLKHKEEGKISDIEAYYNKAHIGTAIDSKIDWVITSDVNFAFKFGYLFVGEAMIRQIDTMKLSSILTIYY